MVFCREKVEKRQGRNTPFLRNIEPISIDNKKNRKNQT